LRLSAQLIVVLALLCLAVANIYGRSTWSEVEDGVLWVPSAEGVLVAREVASQSPGARANVQPGDILEAINGQPVDSPTDVIDVLHHASDGQSLTYTIARTRVPEILNITVAPIPSGPKSLYYVLAAVGIFSLFIGAGVRFRRPDTQATLHFFW